MAIIHNGFIDKRFHDSFKDTGLNDVDLATTKFYKGVKPMWKQLGFNFENSDKPDSKFYWKNIIPKDYTLKPANIFGIEIEDVLPNNQVGVSDGMKIPRKSFKKININKYVSQDWKGNPQPYYPVLPRINEFGIFSSVVDETIFFGSKTSWDGEDKLAPITNLNEPDSNLILNMDYTQDNTDDLIDRYNFNKVNYIKDFQVKLDNNIRIKTDSVIIPDGLEKDNTKQAF